LNYSIILEGTGQIESFLMVDSLTAQEALEVMNHALDILIAFRLENKTIPPWIQQCLLDYMVLFLGDINEGAEIKQIISGVYSQKYTVEKLFEALNNKVELSFNKIPFLEFDLDARDIFHIFNELIIELNKCNYNNGFILLHALKRYSFSKSIGYPIEEISLLLQAERYLATVATSIGDIKFIWWSKILSGQVMKHEREY